MLKNFKQRWYFHLWQLKFNRHSNSYLQSAWNKNKFLFVILEECSLDKLIEREQFYIDTLKPEYNIKKKADSNLGVKFSEEKKIRHSNFMKGNTYTKGRKLTKEECLRISNYMKGKRNRKGVPTSEETKIKLSNSLKEFYAKRKQEKAII